jgi:hypothetical protein
MRAGRGVAASIVVCPVQRGLGRSGTGYYNLMRDVDAILDELYVGQERVTRDEIYRRVVSAGAPVEVVVALDSLPEGEYAQDEVSEALRHTDGGAQLESAGGIPAYDLGDADLLREMGDVHRTRDETLRHGSEQALAHHDQRTAELEDEYLRRFPEREVDPMRLRAGARERSVRRNWPDDRNVRTGAEQPWEPEDLAVAEGRDPTPEHLRRARAELDQQGPSAIERTVP